MIPLSQLLLRFKSLTNTEKAKKQMICEELSNILGFTIPCEVISFSKNTLFLKVQPIIKSEILLRKMEIIKKIQTLPGLGYIQDIK